MSIALGLQDSIAAGWRLLSHAITAGTVLTLGAIIAVLAAREAKSAAQRFLRF